MKKSYLIIAIITALIIAGGIFFIIGHKEHKNKAPSAPIAAGRGMPVAKAKNTTVVANTATANAAKPIIQQKRVPIPADKLNKSLMPVIGQASLTDSVDKSVKTIIFPYKKDAGAKNETLDFSFYIMFKKGQYTRFRVIPDDCVKIFTVNNKSITPDGNFPRGSCDWNNGFNVDLKEFLKEGGNVVHIRVINYAGPTGLRIFPQPLIEK